MNKRIAKKILTIPYKYMIRQQIKALSVFRYGEHNPYVFDTKIGYFKHYKVGNG